MKFWTYRDKNNQRLKAGQSLSLNLILNIISYRKIKINFIFLTNSKLP